MKMNKSIVLIFATTLLAMANTKADQLKQFPEPGKEYVPGRDAGFEVYRTKTMLNTREVVLTFDDGPHNVNTPKTLDLLKKYNAKATFFVLTENINQKTMPIIKRIVEEGHVLASHHHDHRNNNGKAELVYRNELTETVKMISELNQKFGGSKEIYYRFPYGEYGSGKLEYHHFNVMKEVSKELFRENCINFAFWDIDSLDWLAPMDESDIVSNVMAHLEGGKAYNMKKGRFSGKYKKDAYEISRPYGGGVVLMHDIHEKSVKALEKLLPRLQQSGFRVVPISTVQEFKYGDRACELTY